MGDFDGIQEYLVNGYRFEYKEEYESALQEKKGVEYLDAQTDYKDLNKVLSIYTELIQKKIFYTPVGLDYLRKLRSLLISSGQIEKYKILPIYVPSYKKKDNARLEKYISNKYKERVNELDKNFRKAKNSNKTSIMLNIILVFVIIAMFVILSTSDNPNVLNYERVLQDKYASWSEDLKAKEKELRDWEKRLTELEEEILNDSQK